MPFVSREELDELYANTERLSAFEEMSHLLELANTIRTDISQLLEEQPALSTQEIGDRAYAIARDGLLETARDEVVAAYEQEHRTELYKRVVNEVKDEEGKVLFQEVRTRLETDPDLALELRESARKELGARALNVVRQQITEEQAEIIEQEAQRQIELDRLDVELALEGELEQLRDDVMSLLQPNDRLVLYFSRPDDLSTIYTEQTFEWRQDVNKNLGWVAVGDAAEFYDGDGYRVTLPSDKFTVIGSKLPNYIDGEKVNIPNTLKIHEAVALMIEKKSGGFLNRPSNIRSVSGYTSRSSLAPAVLVKSDFQTKTLHF